MLGCFNPILGQIWTNPAIGLHFNPMFEFVHILPKFGVISLKKNAGFF